MGRAGSHWLAAQPASAATARAVLRAEFVHADVPDAAANDAELLVSELVANAVRHARPLPGNKIRLRWDLDDTSVTVAVTDGGGIATPTVRNASPHETSGRGLAIVEALAADWGNSTDDDGCTTWARLSFANGLTVS